MHKNRSDIIVLHVSTSIFAHVWTLRNPGIQQFNIYLDLRSKQRAFRILRVTWLVNAAVSISGFENKQNPTLHRSWGSLRDSDIFLRASRNQRLSIDIVVRFTGL